MEEQLAVDGLAAEADVELVEVILPGGELVGEEIGQRYDLSGGAARERACDGSAAIPAAQQAEAYGGVGLIAEGGAGLEEQESGGGGGCGLEELATVHRGGFSVVSGQWSVVS